MAVCDTDNVDPPRVYHDKNEGNHMTITLLYGDSDVMHVLNLIKFLLSCGKINGNRKSKKSYARRVKCNKELRL